MLPSQISIEEVVRTFCLENKVSYDAILSRSKYTEIRRMRWALIFFLRAYGQRKLKEIGRFLNRDHSTILYAFVEVQKKQLAEPEYAKWLKAINPFAALEDRMALASKKGTISFMRNCVWWIENSEDPIEIRRNADMLIRHIENIKSKLSENNTSF